MTPILAQVAGFSLVHWAIIVLVCAGVIAIVGVIVKQAGLAIPQFIITIFWIVLAVVVGVVAIRILVSLV